MTRKYELRQRAERQEQTRRRIVEAAVELHRTKGPARTSLSEVARLAGVQRHTLYRHFPDERDLSLACSGLYYELNPPPDPAPWRAIPDPGERLSHGLSELYAFYERNEEMFTSILRDAEVDPLTREMFQLRAGEPFARIRAVLAEPLSDGPRVQAALDLAVDFRTWQRLVRSSGLHGEVAVELMISSIRCQ